MAKKIDPEKLKEKVRKARERKAKKEEALKKKKKKRIEEKAQETAGFFIDRLPEALEEGAAEGQTEIRVFWYGVLLGRGNFEGTAANEKAMDLVEAYCREQGFKTERRDGEWNSPDMVHEYHLYVDLS